LNGEETVRQAKVHDYLSEQVLNHDPSWLLQRQGFPASCFQPIRISCQKMMISSMACLDLINPLFMGETCDRFLVLVEPTIKSCKKQIIIIQLSLNLNLAIPEE
jgi:hypothetical protein